MTLATDSSSSKSLDDEFDEMRLFRPWLFCSSVYTWDCRDSGGDSTRAYLTIAMFELEGAPFAICSGLS